MTEQELSDFLSDELSGDVKENIQLLQAKLDDAIPKKSMDSNLIIATWNIKAFGSLTEKWVSDPNDEVHRDLHSLRCIAEIITRFDVVAIQEVSSDLKALRYLMKFLNPHWGLLMTDETKGDRGNNERLAFLFDKRRVSLSGLAGEIVIPDEKLSRDEVTADNLLKTQFARTPYTVSFISKKSTFVLVTLHIRYKGSKRDRIPELYDIAGWLGDWALNINSWEHNLITLGDFNIDRKDDEMYKAFTSKGLEVHPHFYNLPRTYADLGKKPNEQKFYDQIAWFTGDDGRPALSMKFLKGGFFNFTESALKNRGLTNKQLQHYISDHFPLWAEFEIRDLGEDFIPKVPDRLNEEQKKIRDEDKRLRKAINKKITSIENAISSFLYIIDSETEPEIELVDLARNHLISKGYHVYCLRRLEKEILDTKDDNEMEAVLLRPIETARKLAKNAIALVKDEKRGDNENKILKEDLVDLLKPKGYWPFTKE